MPTSASEISVPLERIENRVLLARGHKAAHRGLEITICDIQSGREDGPRRQPIGFVSGDEKKRG
jgi:hypothetical protein